MPIPFCGGPRPSLFPHFRWSPRRGRHATLRVGPTDTHERGAVMLKRYGGWLGGLALALLLLSACGGRGAALASEDRAVSDVRAVRVEGSGTLIITRGEREALTIEAEPSLLPEVVSEQRDGTLVLGLYQRSLLRPTGPVIYRLTVTDLHTIEATGSTEVTASDLAGERLTVIITSSSDVRVSGAVDRQEVTVSGSGDYLGDGLRSAAATVRVSGSGDALVHASAQLEVTISGSGEVRYLGAPQVAQQISGSGDLVRVGE